MLSTRSVTISLNFYSVFQSSLREIILKFLLIHVSTIVLSVKILSRSLFLTEIEKE